MAVSNLKWEKSSPALAIVGVQNPEWTDVSSDSYLQIRLN